MKAAAWGSVILAGAVFFSALAQVPQGTQLQGHPRMTFYRETPQGKKLDFVITGSSATNVSARTILIKQFELKSFHNGDPKLIQIIAQAPQCRVDVSNNVASDAGPLLVFTPTTNLFVQGVGFIFTQFNHFLVISNQVETRVVKSLLRSSMLAPPRTNPAADSGQVIEIYAEYGEFDFNSNVVNYTGHVHMIDSQLDMTSDFLTIRFTTNGAVESILARQNVVLTTTNNGVATGATGFYYVTNGTEIMQLTKDAKWRHGDEAADAQNFTYDSTRHILTGIGHVRVQWPNAAPTTNPTPLLVGSAGFRELFADFASLQFPPAKGPVERMYAHGNVLILNQADESSATAERAVYEKSTDRVELTGNPVWWNGHDTNTMEVRAETLWADLGDKTYHARSNARFKMRTGSGANHSAAATGQAAGQWLFITSEDMDYQTNQAAFFRNVETRVVEEDRVEDTLHCALLTVNLINNQVEGAFASGQVRGETAPDAAGVVKTIACEQLNAYRSVKTLLMKSIDAHTHVVIEEHGQGPAAPRNRLAADAVLAQFSAVTNKIEQAVAGPNVVLDQYKGAQHIHATAEHGVYSAGVRDQVKLTGAPLALKDNYLITDSDYMIWLPKANTFQAIGRYNIVPITPAAGQK